MAEKIKPLNPLNIEFSKLKHAELFHDCEGCKDQKILQNLVELIELPSVKPEEKPTNTDKIKEADDTIKAIFKLFNPRIDQYECDKEQIIKALELETPKVDTPGPAKLREALVEQIVEKLLEKMDQKVAVIKGKDKCFSCGNLVEIFTVGDVKPIDKFPELSDDQKDGVIEDLEGVIEVTK